MDPAKDASEISEWDWVIRVAQFLDDVRDILSLGSVSRGAWAACQHDQVWRIQWRIRQEDRLTRWPSCAASLPSPGSWKDAFVKQYLTDRNLGRGGHSHLRIHIVEGAGNLVASVVTRDHCAFLGGDTQGWIHCFAMGSGLLRRSNSPGHTSATSLPLFKNHSVQHLLALGPLPEPLPAEDLEEEEEEEEEEQHKVDPLWMEASQLPQEPHQLVLAVSSKGLMRLLAVSTAASACAASRSRDNRDGVAQRVHVLKGMTSSLPRPFEARVASAWVDHHGRRVLLATQDHQLVQMPLSGATGLPLVERCSLIQKTRNLPTSISSVGGALAFSNTGVAAVLDGDRQEHFRIFEQRRHPGTQNKVVRSQLHAGGDAPELLVAGSDGLLRFVDVPRGEVHVMNERVLCDGAMASSGSPRKGGGNSRAITSLSSDGHLVAYGDASGFVYVGGAHHFRAQLAHTRRLETMAQEGGLEENETGKGEQVPVFSKLSAGTTSSPVLSVHSFRGIVVATVRNQVVVHDFSVQ